MSHVGARSILEAARRGGYGVPCLLAGNLEMLVGAVRAAETAGAPVILAYNTQVTPGVPMELMMPAMAAAAERAAVPVATILDHGASLESAQRAVDLGASTVMYDGSQLPFAENVRRTAEVVRMAHAAGVDVEGELGVVGGSSVELGYVADAHTPMTDPDLAVQFAEATGVDVLAIAFGNVHGIYAGEPQLDLARVRQIAGRVRVPLAMHGASGLPAATYHDVIAAGISKVNYYTAMARTITHALRDELVAADETELVYHHVIAAAIDGFRAETEALLRVLGGAV